MAVAVVNSFFVVQLHSLHRLLIALFSPIRTVCHRGLDRHAPRETLVALVAGRGPFLARQLRLLSVRSSLPSFPATRLQSRVDSDTEEREGEGGEDS